jgi:hypothetical protein
MGHALWVRVVTTPTSWGQLLRRGAEFAERIGPSRNKETEDYGRSM